MLRKHSEISKFRNRPLRAFAARFDFEIFDVFEIITPLYTPREAINFEISKEFGSDHIERPGA